MFDRFRVARHYARRFAAWCCIAIAAGAAADTALPQAPQALPQAQQRELYIQALEALDAGRFEAFQLAMAQLADYPLYPYLDYQDHRRRLSDLSPSDIRDFRARWSDSPIAGRLFEEWLDDLADRNQWPTFIEYYEDTGNVERQCVYLRALDRSGARTKAMEGVRPLWMVGTTQPKACDPLFAAWIQRGNVNNGMVWDRLTLALQARSWDLAHTLAGLLTSQLKRQGELFYKVARDPALVRDTTHFTTDDEATRAIVTHGLKRLAVIDPDGAAAAWAVYRKSLSFDSEDARTISQDVTIGLARRGVIDPNADLAPSPDGRHVKVSEALILASLNNKNWPCVITLIDGLDGKERGTERWRYWLGRAQRALSGAPQSAAAATECPSTVRKTVASVDYPATVVPSDGAPNALSDTTPTVTAPNAVADAASAVDTPSAVADAASTVDAPRAESDAPSAVLAAATSVSDAAPPDIDPWSSIAAERQYYGFLAAEALGKAPALNYQSSRPERPQLDALQQRPAMLRIAELYALGDRSNARREWNFLLPRLDAQTRLVAPYVLADIGWTDLSVISAGKMPELKDDLTLRFPSPYTPTFAKESKATTIPIGFLYGIARQESAFGPTARSPVGALGLMQLMPATAAATARAMGEPAPGTTALFEPDVNVHIASRHLAELLERYDGNRVLAAAAYNAGANRVDRWLRDRPARPADVWIESIPFAETRDYVQNVMAFSYIYGQRLGHPTKFLDSDER
jgi:soluble lytic murein transglycosylase-like protein